MVVGPVDAAAGPLAAAGWQVQGAHGSVAPDMVGAVEAFWPSWADFHSPSERQNFNSYKL